MPCAIVTVGQSPQGYHIGSLRPFTCSPPPPLPLGGAQEVENARDYIRGILSFTAGTLFTQALHNTNIKTSISARSLN